MIKISKSSENLHLIRDRNKLQSWHKTAKIYFWRLSWTSTENEIGITGYSWLGCILRDSQNPIFRGLLIKISESSEKLDLIRDRKKRHRTAKSEKIWKTSTPSIRWLKVEEKQESFLTTVLWSWEFYGTTCRKTYVVLQFYLTTLLLLAEAVGCSLTFS